MSEYSLLRQKKSYFMGLVATKLRPCPLGSTPVIKSLPLKEYTSDK
jgi:hypothetical protein